MNEWISVEERLPEIFADVLVYDELGIGYAARRPLPPKYSRRNVGWLECDKEIHGVTHWMPLPSPPSEESVNV